MLHNDSAVQLRDGRKLAYLEVGTKGGFPIFHFHGHSSSRLEALLAAEQAAKLGVRVISFDRPGIGLSDAKPKYKILDWPDDVADAADRLGIPRFAVEGVSSGSIYAMACAYKIPDRLTACGLVSTVAPRAFITKAGPEWMRALWEAEEFLPRLFAWYVRLAMRISGQDEAGNEKWLTQYAEHLGDADRKVLNTDTIRKYLAEASTESFRQGDQADVDEALAGVGPWGFEVEHITFKKIFLWHGLQDYVIPIAPIRLLVEALPHHAATFYPTDGHFSTPVNHSEEILRALST